MKHSFLTLFFLCLPSLAFGQLIGLNFSSDRETAELLPGELAGVVPQQNWNNWLAVPSDVTEDTLQTQGEIASPNAGVITDGAGNTHPGVTVEWSSRNAWNTNNGETNGDNKLMNGYLDNNADTPQVSVTIGGLPESIASGFDVYAYYGSDGNGRTGTITDGIVTYSYSTFSNQGGDFPNQYIQTTDLADGNPESNYAVFSGLSGGEVTITLDRGSNNSGLHGIQIIGGAEPQIPGVSGNGTIADNPVSSSVVEGSLMFGDPVEGPGLAQEWYAVGNPYDGNLTPEENRPLFEDVFANNLPIVPAFQSEGGSWWTGGASLPGVQNYPPEVQPQITDQYTVRSTGEILIEESGLYSFTDGVDDYSYLAIDTDKSGVAGDSPEEILINDNAWTNPLRDGNGGGEGSADVSITVDGPEWLDIEFNMAEGGGGDHGVVYWDYDTTAPQGLRLGGLILPFVDQAFFSEEEAAAAVIPDSHLRSTTAPLVAGEVTATVPNSPSGWNFEIDAANGTFDSFSVDSPDADVYATTLDVDGAIFHIDVTAGEVSEGDSYQIINANSISGTPTIATDGWTWDGATGSVIFGSGGGQTCGDFDMDGDIDAADRTIQTVGWTGAIGDGSGTATFGDGDCDGDGDVDTADQTGLIGNWTGAQAGNLTDGEDADLVYDPATGNVTIDASDTAAGQIISFVIGTDQNNMDTSATVVPFIDAGTNTDNTPFQIGQTDPLNQGAGPMVDIGNVLPTGMDLTALSEYLTIAEYASELGAGGTLDLRVVPEPSGLVLALLGLFGLATRRRR